MQGLKAKKVKKVVFFGTGGTISALSSDPNDVLNYQPGLIAVGDLAQSAMAQGGGLEGFLTIYEQIAQIDSKDMKFSIWQKLIERLLFWSKDPDVQGFLITHGTDTIEETAFFLYLATRELKQFPTIVLTCSMRPASAKDADGTQNLRDATALLLDPSWFSSGVMVVCAGRVHHAGAVQKVYSERLDAFSSLPYKQCGEFVNGSPVKLELGVEENYFSNELGISRPSIEQILEPKEWPWVEVVQNYAQNTGAVVRALLGYVQPSGLRVSGLVSAGTGIGTLSEELTQTLKFAKERGVLLWQSSKCAFAIVKAKEETDIFDFQGLTPSKARIALIMHLLSKG